MNLATFRVSGVTTWSIIEDEQAADIGAVLPSLPDLKSAIAAEALSASPHTCRTPSAARYRRSSGCR